MYPTLRRRTTVTWVTRYILTSIITITTTISHISSEPSLFGPSSSAQVLLNCRHVFIHLVLLRFCITVAISVVWSFKFYWKAFELIALNRLSLRWSCNDLTQSCAFHVILCSSEAAVFIVPNWCTKIRISQSFLSLPNYCSSEKTAIFF